MDIDQFKNTCLHFAAQTGRADNIRVILAHNPNLINLRNKKNWNAMALASRYGHLEAVKALLESPKAKINTGCGPERLTPLSYASAYNYEEMADWLLDNKARVLSKDKFARTPLVHACMNGNLKIASKLL